MSTLPASAARLLLVGDWFLYRNRYDQYFNAKLLRKHLTEDGRMFLMVKREEWPREESLALSDFENGEYTLLV